MSEKMRDAVIVSTARTPLAKSIRGAFNATHPVQLGAWSVEAAVQRAGLDGGAAVWVNVAGEIGV